MIANDDECMGCDAKPEIEFIVQTMADEEPIDRVTLCTKCAKQVGGPFEVGFGDDPRDESLAPFWEGQVPNGRGFSGESSRPDSLLPRGSQQISAPEEPRGMGDEY